MITILIPTAKRPELLANALKSISEQTAINEIAEIIVSENAGDSRSGEICKQFPHLPIQYILRDVQSDMSEHFSSLKKHVWAGDFTVMLHDDDWWTPDFLSQGLKAFEANPQAACFCCNSYSVPGEFVDHVDCEQIFPFWFGNNYPRLDPLWKLNAQEVLLACVLCTPAFYSTIMGRAEAFRASAVIYDTGNKWDVDRMFIFELSRHGNLLYSPLPAAFYRHHANQLTHALTISYQNEQMAKTTDWMLDRAKVDYESLGDLFYNRFRSCPNDAKSRLYDAALLPWALPTLVKHLNASSELVRLYEPIFAQRQRQNKINSFVGNAANIARKVFKPLMGGITH